MSSAPDFRSTVTSLWFRLITLAVVALVFFAALFLARGKAEGWSYYLTAPEVAFEVVVRLVAAALAGLALGTLGTLAIAPFLWHFESSRQRLADGATKVAAVLAVFLASRVTLEALIEWSTHWSGHGPRFYFALRAAFYLAFVAALFISRARKGMVTSLQRFVSEKMTRRTAIATVAGTAALVATEFALTRSAPTVKAALAPRRPNPTSC